MTGKVAAEKMTQYREANSTISNSTFDPDTVLEDEAGKVMMIEIATAISFAVGIWQVRI